VLLVNAYITYKKVQIEAGRERFMLSQFEFRQTFALAWVSSDEPTIAQRKQECAMNTAKLEAVKRRYHGGDTEEGPIKKKRHSTPQSASSTRSGTKRAPKLTDITIQSTYAKRLNMFVPEGHFPEEKPGQRVKCALHKWAANIEKRRRECLQLFLLSSFTLCAMFQDIPQGRRPCKE